jgi:hypothetical protein
MGPFAWLRPSSAIDHESAGAVRNQTGASLVDQASRDALFIIGRRKNKRNDQNFHRRTAASVSRTGEITAVSR